MEQYNVWSNILAGISYAEIINGIFLKAGPAKVTQADIEEEFARILNENTTKAKNELSKHMTKLVEACNRK